jgi:hypothetical protein
LKGIKQDWLKKFRNERKLEKIQEVKDRLKEIHQLEVREDPLEGTEPIQGIGCRNSQEDH